ncbi:hypothetical protein N2152v2_000346 [Parachlorella kessleri]
MGFSLRLVLGIASMICTAYAEAQAGGGAIHGNSGGLGLSDWIPPAFCGEADCPEYTVWQKSHQFEARRYKPSTWVATMVEADKLDAALPEGLKRLDDYIAGGNEAKEQLACTLPVMAVYPLEGHPHKGSRTNYTVAIYLPYNKQDEPPKPTSNQLFIFNGPNVDMYVRMYREPASQARVVEEVRDLAAALEHAGHDYVKGEVHAAMYGCAEAGVCASGSDTVSSLGAALLQGGVSGGCRHPHNEVWLRSPQPPSSATAREVE